MTDHGTGAGALSDETPTRRAAWLIPLWLSALSLAVIAVALVIGVVELGHALGALTQVQEQMSKLQGGLGGLLGG